MATKTYSAHLLTTQFMGDKSIRTFLGFAADLGLSPGKFPNIIFLESTQTGRRARFVKMENIYDQEGDLTHVSYYPDMDTVERIETLRGWKLTIFND